MYKEFYAGMEWTALPLVALVFFLLAFALILLRTFAARRARDFDRLAALPLGDGIPFERANALALPETSNPHEVQR